MRYLLVIFMFLLSGCSVTSYLDKLPNTEFETFEYHRSGNVTSAHIIASDSKVVDGRLEVKNINITGDYGPAFNINVKITGYKQDAERGF